jgi:hypothetical protein
VNKKRIAFLLNKTIAYLGITGLGIVFLVDGRKECMTAGIFFMSTGLLIWSCKEEDYHSDTE